MAHWRELMEPTEYFGRPKLMAFNQVDPQNRSIEVTYKIVDTKAGEVPDQKRGKSIKKPILILIDRNKKEWSFPVNVTICKTLEKLYGDNPFAWPGHLLTLYVTTTSVGGEETYCLRVRPKIPEGKSAAKAEGRPNDRIEPPAEQPANREPGEEG